MFHRPKGDVQRLEQQLIYLEAKNGELLKLLHRQHDLVTKLVDKLVAENNAPTSTASNWNIADQYFRDTYIEGL